jgi:hypothetical protein
MFPRHPDCFLDEGEYFLSSGEDLPEAGENLIGTLR